MIAIIKYHTGNISSIQNALTRFGHESIVTDDPDTIQRAERVILPGVGMAEQAMFHLRDTRLDQVIIGLEQPVLGICLGMHVLCNSSEEGNVRCLGIFDVDVQRLPTGKIVPHMGWNDFDSLSGDLCKNVSLTDHVYYVHSYYATLGTETVATCTYHLPFSCILQRDNFCATQFHPEKSGEIGAKLLENFLAL